MRRVVVVMVVVVRMMVVVLVLTIQLCQEGSWQGLDGPGDERGRGEGLPQHICLCQGG